MRTCSKCNLKISGSFKKCPICDYELKGESSSFIFPFVKEPKKLIIKTVVFLSFVISLLSLFIEYYTSGKFDVSYYIILGLVTNFLVLKALIKKYSNLIKRLNSYFILILLIFLIWHFFTNSYIITTYLIPILIMFMGLVNSVMMIIYRKNFMKRFGGVVLFNIFIGFIPLVIVLLKKSNFPIIAYVSFLLYIIFFIGVFIFYRKNLFDEFKKTFNI